MSQEMTRRAFLRAVSVGGSAALLAACGAQPATTPPQAAAETAPSADSGAALAPTAASSAAQSGSTLSYWVAFGPNSAVTIKNYGEMTTYIELQKRTGTSLTFQHPSGAQISDLNEQFNLMIASGKYPDIIEWSWLAAYPGGPAKAINDGVILRLNELIDQHAPNLKRVLEANPDWRKQIVTDEGDIYCFPSIYGDPLLLVFAGPVVRKDWLDKLGLKPPTTIDEWTTTLTAIKNGDPNGNGQADEAPFSPFLFGVPAGAFARSSIFVGAWGITTAFYQDQGVIKYGPLQPEFKQFLEVMANWYKAGLIDPDTFGTDTKAMDAKVTGDKLGTAVMALGGGVGKYMGLMKDKGSSFDLLALPYPTLKTGQQPILGQRDNAYPGYASAAITTSNKHVEESVRLLDYAYGEEGHLLFNFGVEGVTYVVENGVPRWADGLMNHPTLPVAQALAQHLRVTDGAPFVKDKLFADGYFALPQQQEGLKLWSQPSNERQLPPLTPTQEESRRFSRVMTEVNARYDEVFAKVVTGAQPLESWDGFVQELGELGIEEAIATQQAALDRYTKRA